MACAVCGAPERSRACAWGLAAPVLTVEDMQPHKLAVREHLRALGLDPVARTRLLLARAGEVFSTTSGLRGATQYGDTRWRWSGDRVQTPIQVRLAGGLPGPVFRRTLAHELAHAAIAGGPAMSSLPLPLLEGFAECVALVHLRAAGSICATTQADRIERSRDPVYGDGYRRVRPAVEAHGLVAVAAALHHGTPERVGLTR